MPISKELWDCYSNDGKQMVSDDELILAIKQSREKCGSLSPMFEETLAKLEKEGNEKD
jgi:hypothetical protein